MLWNEDMKILTIDSGTSSSKAAIFEGDEMVIKKRNLSVEELLAFALEQKPDRIVACSVSSETEKLKHAFHAFSRFLFLDHNTPLPINNNYKSKETLGKDRLAAIVGVSALFPEISCLVIDAGTCITYDIIDAGGNYLGGSISPGIDLKFKALNNYTAKLPLVSRKDSVELIGDTTENAILSGVVWGVLAEIREISRIYHNKFPHLQLVICGGDADYLANRLNMELKLVPDLVLTGLKVIQDYNEQN